MTGNEGFSRGFGTPAALGGLVRRRRGRHHPFAHSHCYGGFETLGSSPRKTFVAWGLGNFLFGGNRGWRNRNDVRLLSIRLDTVTGGKSACWLYGKTSNWQFSLYRMDEAVLRQAQDLGPGLPPP